MDKFLAKFDEAFQALNTSSLWEAIKSIVGKLRELLGFFGETEAEGIIGKIFPETDKAE